MTPEEKEKTKDVLGVSPDMSLGEKALWTLLALFLLVELGFLIL